MTLYEMTQQAQALYDMLTCGEIDEQAFNDTLESIGADEKINSYCEIIQQLKADSASCEAEIYRLSSRKESFDKNIDRMKQALDSFLKAKGRIKEKTDKFTVSYRKSERVQILDETVIPTSYIKVKETKSIDKTGIKQAIIDGISVPGVILEQCQNLQIK